MKARAFGKTNEYSTINVENDKPGEPIAEQKVTPPEISHSGATASFAMEETYKQI